MCLGMAGGGGLLELVGMTEVSKRAGMGMGSLVTEFAAAFNRPWFAMIGLSKPNRKYSGTSLWHTAGQR